MAITLQALSLVGKAEPVRVHFTLHLGTNGVCECKMDVKLYLDFYRPNTKPGDHDIPNAHTVYVIIREDLHDRKFIEIALG